AGAIEFADLRRHRGQALLQRLAGLGVTETVMLTGDREASAEVIAAQAGIRTVRANLLPADKVAAVEELKRRYGTTVMVGDGINDAPALAAATVGIAMGAHGTAISAEAADVVLLGEDIARDGSYVRVRPIRPEDRERLRVGLHQLSAASRYHRFLAALSELSAEQLRYLTEVDQVNHLAWIALDPALAGEPAVGVARCIRVPEDPAMAEVAVTVLDAYQGRGLGTLLLGLLSRSAAAQGIRTFRAYV